MITINVNFDHVPHYNYLILFTIDSFQAQIIFRNFFVSNLTKFVLFFQDLTLHKSIIPTISATPVSRWTRPTPPTIWPSRNASRSFSGNSAAAVTSVTSTGMPWRGTTPSASSGSLSTWRTWRGNGQTNMSRQILAKC